MCHQDLWRPLEVGTVGEEMPQQVVCYRAGEETGGLDSSRSPHWIVLPMAFYVSTFHCVFSSTYQQHCSLLCGSDIFLF